MDQVRVAGLRVSVLRGVEARRDGVLLEVPGPRLRSLLALLALTPGVPRRAEYLADQLWDGEPPSANALQALISRLRRTLGTDAVLSRPTGYLLAVAPEQVDLVRFDQLLAEGTPAATREALVLAGPEPLAEFADVPDLADEARRVEAACWRARTGDVPGGLRLIGRDQLIAEVTARQNGTRLLTPRQVADRLDDGTTPYRLPERQLRMNHVKRAGGVPSDGRRADDRVRRMRKVLRSRTEAVTQEPRDELTGEAG